MQGFLILELNFLTNYKSLFLGEKEGDISSKDSFRGLRVHLTNHNVEKLCGKGNV